MSLLDEQKEYYRQRAGEYDEWWYRKGQYALEPAAERRWFADVAEAEAALDRFAPTGDVLEYACGTGLWTRHLARHARRVLAVDNSPEVIALNRDRLPETAPVEYLRADIFAWRPPVAAFDACFFGYWLSHVPAEKLSWFWQRVGEALRPAGRVFFVDSAGPASGWEQERRLNDGRRFRIVKRLWQPAELVAAGRDLGWDLRVTTTANGSILYGHGQPRGDRDDASGGPQ